MSNVQVYEATPELPPTAALTPLDMLNAAVERGADIAVLERLMGLHERFETTQARRAFDNAIACAKAEIAPVVKNRPGHNGRKYADFAAVSNAVSPALAKHGLSFRFRTAQTDTRISVTCILSHRDGHSEETTLAGPADTSGSKNAIQAIGSTLSYLQRYSLTQALGLAATEDDDGRAAGAGETITDEQVDRLAALITETKSNVNGLLKIVGAESLSDIRADRFDVAHNLLIAKRGK